MVLFSRSFVRKRMISLATTASVAATSFALADDPARTDHVRETMPIQHVADQPDHSGEQLFLSESDASMRKMMAGLILFLGAAAIRSMPTDIFPEIRIPVVTVIWQYTGLTTAEMEQRVSTYSQYSISANVNGIKNMEAQTLNGLSIQKIYFQPDVNLDLAIAQIVSATNAIRALMPPGIQPPIVVQFNASSVPVLQLSLNSDSLNEQQLYDFGIYRVRQQLAPVPGVTLPTPAGGKYRQIMVDIDPDKLLSRGLTPLDIVNAVNTQNLTLPSGTAQSGDTRDTGRSNATPASINDLNMITL